MNAEVDATSRKVLVVDDDRDSVFGLALLLEADGHEVRTAYDAAAALDEAKRFRPELVILDLELGDASGYELAQRLRREVGSAPLLVALTGYDGEQVRARCTEAGFDRHMLKPIIDFDAMREFVRTLGGRAPGS